MVLLVRYWWQNKVGNIIQKADCGKGSSQEVVLCTRCVPKSGLLIFVHLFMRVPSKYGLYVKGIRLLMDRRYVFLSTCILLQLRKRRHLRLSEFCCVVLKVIYNLPIILHQFPLVYKQM